MNKVFLIGNITRDIKIKYTPSGKAVVNTGLAINRKYKVEGEEKEEVCFVDVIAQSVTFLDSKPKADIIEQAQVTQNDHYGAGDAIPF